MMAKTISARRTDDPMATHPISRRSLLAVGALTLAGCATGPTIARPTASPTGTITQQLDSVLTVIANGNEKLGVALRDLRSKKDYGFNGKYSSQSASMAKPMIVAMALRKARADGGALSAEHEEQARKAITMSDNDSADALWAYAGGADAYQALAQELELPATHRDEKNFWSWTWTTPADQVLLLRRLREGTPALTQQERSHILGLMGQVTSEQTWGVGSPRTEGVTVEMKNGWVQFQSTDKLWAVNSMGHLEGQGRDYLLAIMSRTPDFDTGRELCSEIGRQVFSILGSGSL